MAVSAVAAAVQTAGSLGKETSEVTKAAVVAAVQAADAIGDEAGKSVRDALLAAASLPKDVVESAIK